MVEKVFAVAVLSSMLMSCGDAGNSYSRLARGEMAAFQFHNSPQVAPDVGFQDLSGNGVDLASFGGKVLLLNVWATWCAPCIREMPQLDELQDRLGGEDFQVIAVSTDRLPAGEVEAFLREEIGATHLHVYLDPSITFALENQVSVWPTTILYDREGYELGRISAPAEWDSADAVRLIEAVIEGTQIPS